jgi:hypothetical protein
MANFSRLPDNTPTPHQATAHRVFGWDLDSWKGFTQRSFFFRPGFSSLLIGKKKRCARFMYFELAKLPKRRNDFGASREWQKDSDTW